MKAKVIAMAVLLMAVYCSLALGQAPSPSILEMDVENFVVYHYDISDPTKFAADPNRITPSPTRTFQMATVIADVVSVNGRPARGTLIRRELRLGLTPTPAPGEAIAEITRGALVDQVVEILQANGAPVGSIMATGLAGGSTPPGSPSALAAANSNFTITGGTGAFLGVRGQTAVTTAMQMAGREASVAEDPSSRRINGGGPRHFLFYLIPMVRPEIVTTISGPAVTHSSDFSLVTASKPAAAGEILSTFVTGLGPTRPGVDPGKPFPASPRPW